jgi:hypothetical protein
MPIRKSIAFMLALLVGTTCAAVEPITVLGLPLGGKLKMPIRQCSVREIGSDVRSLCWVGQPTVLKKSGSGPLAVPGANQRPKWAALGTFDASVDNDGTLRRFEFWSPGGNNFIEILNSITGRFGQSDRESPPGASLSTATWRRGWLSVNLFCNRGRDCRTTFAMSDPVAAKQAAAAEKRKDDARPAVP